MPDLRALLGDRYDPVIEMMTALIHDDEPDPQSGACPVCRPIAERALVAVLPDLLDTAAGRDALAARLAASEAIGGYAVIHEWPHPNGSLALGFASSPHLDFDAADNHLAYCEAMQERGQRGSDGRYFIAKWSPVDALDGADR